MKLRLLTTAIMGIVATQAAMAVATTTTQTTAPSSLQDQISYTIGVDMGKNLTSQSINVNPDLLAQGLKDVCLVVHY